MYPDLSVDPPTAATTGAAHRTADVRGDEFCRPSSSQSNRSNRQRNILRALFLFFGPFGSGLLSARGCRSCMSARVYLSGSRRCPKRCAAATAALSLGATGGCGYSRKRRSIAGSAIRCYKQRSPLRETSTHRRSNAIHISRGLCCKKCHATRTYHCGREARLLAAYEPWRDSVRQ